MATHYLPRPQASGPPWVRAWHWFTVSPWVPWLIAALFVATRVAAILCAVTPSSDADWYYWQAQNLAAGRGYIGGTGAPTAFWPPGWPAALALGFRLLGVSPLTVGVLNLVVAALGAWFVQDLARRLFATIAVGRLAVLLLAVYPNSALYVPLALTEVFYTTLLLAACWLVIARPGPTGLVLAGLVFGCATLVKAQTLVMIPVIFAVALLRERDWIRQWPAQLGRGLLVLLVAAAVVAPWTLRNHRALGAWVFVSTNGGYTLLTGNNDTARGDYTPDDPVVRALDARKAALGELGHDAEARRLGMAWIRAHPDRFLGLLPLKFFRLWAPDGEGMWAYEAGSPVHARAPRAFFVLRLANQLWYFALLAGFAAAAVLMLVRRVRRRQRLIDWWVLPYGVAAYPTLICLVFSGQSRFHYPVMPWICMAAAWWVAAMLEKRLSASA